MALSESTQGNSIFVPLLTDAVTIVYALWTVVSTITSLSSGTPRVGLNAGAALMAFAGAGVGLAAWRRTAWLKAYIDDLRRTEAVATMEIGGGSRMLLAGAVAALLVLWWTTRNPILLWAAVVVFYAVCSYVGARQHGLGSIAEPVVVPTWHFRTLHVLAIACALFTLFAFRPRSDDAFYMSMSVGVVNYPDAPLLGVKTIHGPAVDRLPFQPMFAPYRAQSFEALGGYIAYLTRFRSIDVVHLGIATFFGWFAPYAIARLMQLIVGRAWLLGLATTLSYYVIEGSAGRGFANQAFVRMFHGKAVMLTVGVPLLLAYGVRFGRRPTRLGFLLLAAAQIGAMGMSSTGIWLAPTLALLAVLSAIERPSSIPRTAGLALLSSSYVLAVGLLIRAQLVFDDRWVQGLTAASASRSFNGISKMLYLFPNVLGEERTATALLCAVALACVLAEGRVAFRLFALIGLVLFGAFANPYLVKQVAGGITGSLTYERVLWLLPVPVGVGVAIVGVVGAAGRCFGRNAGVLAGGAALLTFYCVATTQTVIGDANQAWFRFPPVVKAWPRAQAVARALCEIAPLGAAVLAPEGVSRQLATLEHCGHPLMAGMRWMSAPRDEQRRRILLARALCEKGTIEPERNAQYASDLHFYHIAAVAMSPAAIRSRPAKSMLRAAGFRKERVVDGYHLWVRADGAVAHRP